MIKNSIIPAFLGLLTVFLTACGDNPIPKKTAYFRIELPEKKYQLVDTLSCGFGFEIPSYAFVKPSPDMKPGDQCWYNIYFPRFKGEVYLTYKTISKETPLVQLLEDLHKTAYGHSARADNISARTFEYPEEKKYGIIYDVDGNVASQMQFCITDSTSRFIRGSLYFACPPNKDSLAPVVKFIRSDIEHFIASFKWQ